MDAIEMIESMQKGKENTPAWMVGEQLKDLCRLAPKNAELIATDLEQKSMSLEAAAGKIKELADEKHKKNKGSCICVTPIEAENVLRKFYGLPEIVDGDSGRAKLTPTGDEASGGEVIDLADFL